MNKKLDNPERLIFSPKHNYLAGIVISLGLLVIIIGSSENGVGAINGTALLVGFVVAILTFLLVSVVSPRSKVVVQKNHIHYKKKSLDLAKLVDVQNTRTIFLSTRLAPSANFALRLRDKDNNQLSIPNLGNWENQDQLIAIIGKYAKDSGATMDKQTNQLFENAKSRVD